MSKLKSTVTGAATGAAAGSVFGPWGTAGGALIGGAMGYFGAGDDKAAPSYDPNHQNFLYGLGPSDSYANQQSHNYDQRQQELAALGADAYNRTAPTQAMPDAITQAQSGGQGYLQGADAQSRALQLQALGGVQAQTGALNKFAEAPEGPSAAQAQLQAGTDMAARQQYGMARSQPGGGGAALRNAAFNAAGISGNAANAAAGLRAQETQAYRAQQLQALGAAQTGAGISAGLTGQIRGADQGFAQAQAGQANYDANATNQFNQGQQQLQEQVGANNLTAAGQARGQNDALTLGTVAASQGYDAQRNNLAAGQTQSQENYEGAKLQGKGLGAANFNAANQQSNTETATMLGALSGAAGAYGQIKSDVRAKTDIKPASVLAALGGKYTPEQTRKLYEQGQAARYGVPAQLNTAHDANARSAGPDRSLSEFDAAPPNLRPARGYEYSYKNPEADGAGRYVGPMAQDLEHLPGVVEQSPDGQKSINAPRLTLANTAAVSEQQRRLDELERRQQLQALGYNPSITEAYPMRDLDDAQRRSAAP